MTVASEAVAEKVVAVVAKAAVDMAKAEAKVAAKVIRMANIVAVVAACTVHLTVVGSRYMISSRQRIPRLLRLR